MLVQECKITTTIAIGILDPPAGSARMSRMLPSRTIVADRPTDLAASNKAAPDLAIA